MRAWRVACGSCTGPRSSSRTSAGAWPTGLLERFHGHFGWGIRCKRSVEGVKKGQVLGIITGRLRLTKEREKDTNHPYHCFLTEMVVKDKPMYLQVQGAAGFAGLLLEYNAQLINHKCKKSSCKVEYVQPLEDDKPGYLLVRAKRDIKPGFALTMTYQNVKSLAVCQRAAEELGPGW